MYSLVLAALMQPAMFTVELDGPPDAIIIVGGCKVEAGQVYQTQPLEKEITVKVEIRYVDGDRLVVHKQEWTLEAGMVNTLTVTIKARRLVLNC